MEGKRFALGIQSIHRPMTVAWDGNCQQVKRKDGEDWYLPAIHIGDMYHATTRDEVNSGRCKAHKEMQGVGR
jgi:hypothetical protein